MSTVETNRRAAAGVSWTVDWARTIMIVLAVLGILVAGYMSWAEVTGNETVCSSAGNIDCAAVQESAYAQIMGFPVALMGLFGYIAILAVLVLEDQIGFLAAYGRTLVVSMALFGVMFQTYLMYIEADVLGKWCQWCVISHIIIILLLFIGAWRLQRFFKPLREK